MDFYSTPDSTDLHDAIQKKHGKSFLEIVIKSLDKREDLEAKNAEGFTPLELAVKEDHIKAIEVLIEHGANITDHIKTFIVNKKMSNNTLKAFIKAIKDPEILKSFILIILESNNHLISFILDQLHPQGAFSDTFYCSQLLYASADPSV